MLKDMVIIITGAAKGQGLSHVKVALEKGARVIATDFDAELGQREVDALRAAGNDVVFKPLNVGKRADWEALLEYVKAEYGKVDGLVNNAGISVSADVLGTTEELWDTILDVNQRGPYLGMNIIGGYMAEHGGGSIVNVASTLGKFASPSAFAYQATKGAVRMMTKSAALSLASFGIRVNTVLPGLVDTDFIAKQKQNGAIDGSLARIPLQRLAQPSELSAAVMFLLSKEASYITGAELVVDGGLICGSAGSLKPTK